MNDIHQQATLSILRREKRDLFYQLWTQWADVGRVGEPAEHEAAVSRVFEKLYRDDQDTDIASVVAFRDKLLRELLENVKHRLPLLKYSF